MKRKNCSTSIGIGLGVRLDPAKMWSRSSRKYYCRGVALMLATVMLLPPCTGCDRLGQSELVTAVGEGQEGCAAISRVDNGKEWSASGTMIVPAGAVELFVGSVSGTDNADMNQAEIKLTSPDGSQTILFANGTVTCTGFTEKDLAAPTTDADAEGYLEELLTGLPENPTAEDVDELLTTVLGGDPDAPPPDIPENLFTDIDEYMDTISNYTHSIAAGTNSQKPSDGVIVLGPQAGSWSIEASAQAGAKAFRVMAWALPGVADATSLENIAKAIAGASGAPATAQSHLAAGSSGDDPGCEEKINAFRYPPPDTYEFWRSMAIRELYDVVTWLVLRGLFTKAIGKLIPLGANPNMVSLGLTEEKVKVLSIFVVATIYREVLRYSEIAKRAYWRFVYTVTSPDRYTTVCYLGLWTSVFGWDWEPTVELRPGPPFKTLALCGGNAMKDVLDSFLWGCWMPGDVASEAEWSYDPEIEEICTFYYYGEQHQFLEIEASENADAAETNIIVTLKDQPAKGVFRVTITPETDWYPVESGTDETLTGVWGSSATDVYAVGENGTIVHYDGTKWSPIDTGLDTPHDFNAVWGFSATDVYVGGAGATFLHYDGGSWTPITLRSSDGVLSDIYSVENIWGESPTDLFMVTRFSDWFKLFRFNGSILSPIATPHEDYVDYKFSEVYGLWGSSSTDVYIVNGTYYWGYIYHYEGGEECSVSLKTETENESNVFYDIWGSSATDVFAVGRSGRIYHYNGLTWSRMDSETQEDLSCVWGSSSSDVHAAGGLDTFYHYNGSTWEPMDRQSPVNMGIVGDVKDIWISQDGKGFAVGGYGIVYVYGIL